MSFYNTCDLTIVILPKSCDDKEVDNQENIEEEENSGDNERNESEELDNENEESDIDMEESDNAKDSIHELFLRVFVNDSWSYASQVERPYYSAGIYPDICITCESLDVNRIAKDEHPHCSGCNGNTVISKKRLKWKQGGKGKGKKQKTAF